MFEFSLGDYGYFEEVEMESCGRYGSGLRFTVLGDYGRFSVFETRSRESLS